MFTAVFIVAVLQMKYLTIVGGLENVAVHGLLSACAIHFQRETDVDCRQASEACALCESCAQQGLAKNC